MPKVHVKKGDTVMVIRGKDAGRKGKVLSVSPEKQRVIVEKVNVVKRHSRPTRQMPQGGIVEKEAAIHASNVMLVCGKCHKPTRVGHRIMENEAKVRVCKRCGEILS
jgi:large subunit ribosomal protein L24